MFRSADRSLRGRARGLRRRRYQERRPAALLSDGRGHRSFDEFRVGATPTYYGPAPSNFSIAGITLDDKAFTSECFSIGADTGMVSISNTDALDPGTYKLTIACQAGGGAYRFENIFVVRMVSATPEAIEVSEPTLVIPYAELETTEASVTVAPVGESVSILNYRSFRRRVSNTLPSPKTAL